jgi:TetR/AcrR family transcriptional regulator
LYDRIEAQLRQIIREMPLRSEQGISMDPTVAANLLLSLVEGRISQYVRSDFLRKPTTQWDLQWQAVRNGLFERKVP